MDLQALIQEFGAWAFVAVFAGFLLKYVVLDLRKDNERNYNLACKLHGRMDSLSNEFKELNQEITYLQGKINGRGK
jgi:cell division protein FtsB